MRYNSPRLYRHPAGLEIVLPTGIYRRICKYISAHYPNECGGVLAGRIQGHQAIITRMFMPERIQSTRVRFRRLVDRINIALKKLNDESCGEQLYLGEWHSHPNSLPIPSNTDLSAMCNITASGTVRLTTPFLLIVGYKPEQFIERFYLFTNKTLEQYEMV